MSYRTKTLIRFFIRLFVIVLCLAFGIFLACLPMLFGFKAEWLTAVTSPAAIILVNLLLIGLHLDRRIADRILPKQNIEHHSEPIGLSTPIAMAYYQYWQVFTSKKYSLRRLMPAAAKARVSTGTALAVLGLLSAAVLAYTEMPDEMLVASAFLMISGVAVIALGYIRGALTGLLSVACASVIFMSIDTIDRLFETSVVTAILLIASLLFVLCFSFHLLLRRINRNEYNLPAFDNGNTLCVPMYSIAPENTVVCEVTLSADTRIPHPERHYIIHKAADISSFCYKNKIVYAGLRATKGEPSLTYIAYCSGEIAAERFKRYIERSVDGEITDVVMRDDPEHEVYKSILPGEKALFRAYNSLFADMLGSEERELTLGFSIILPEDGQKADALLSAECSLKFESKAEGVAEATVKGRFTASDLNALTDEAVELAERFETVLLPWTTEPTEQETK